MYYVGAARTLCTLCTPVYPWVLRGPLYPSLSLVAVPMWVHGPRKMPAMASLRCWGSTRVPTSGAHPPWPLHGLCSLHATACAAYTPSHVLSPHSMLQCLAMQVIDCRMSMLCGFPSLRPNSRSDPQNSRISPYASRWGGNYRQVVVSISLCGSWCLPHMHPHCSTVLTCPLCQAWYQEVGSNGETVVKITKKMNPAPMYMCEKEGSGSCCS